jgi:N-glycosylase/DNA lyase
VSSEIRSNILVEDIDKAIAAVASEFSAPIAMPIGWRNSDEGFLWRQLTSCILGSAVRAEHASAAIVALDESGVLGELQLSWRESLYDKINAVLCAPIVEPRTGNNFRYRFPQRGESLLVSAQLFYGRSGSGISAMLEGFSDGRDARRWIAQNVPGLGPKQASLFLRLVDFEPNLAVLDVHILRYLELHGGQINSPPRSLVEYESTEAQFEAHASRFGFSVGVVDYATWIVMRSLDRSNL